MVSRRKTKATPSGLMIATSDAKAREKSLPKPSLGRPGLGEGNFTLRPYGEPMLVGRWRPGLHLMASLGQVH